MKILVCGGRDFDDYGLLEQVLDEILTDLATEKGGIIGTWYEDFGSDFCTIIHGGAKGADTLANRFAEEYSLEKQVYKADWDKHGKSAGYKRNQQMLDEGKPDLVVAFKGGRGTAHMVQIAKKAGIEVKEVL